MCTGTALLYKIPQIVVGENRNYCSPGEQWFMERDVSFHVEQNQECIDLMHTFIKENPELWQEDIHEMK